MSMTEHTCHANFCKTPCKPSHLMCEQHWAMVPKPQQDRVYLTYRPGQCDDMRPSPEWFDAAKLAVALVAQAEGKSTSRHQRELLAKHQQEAEA